MSSLDKYVDEINDKKEMIARAIAMAVADGDVSKAEKYFEEFYRIIKDECPVFILDSSKYYTKFEKRVKENIDELNKMLGYDVEDYLKGKVKRDETNPYNYLKGDGFLNVSKEILAECDKIFMKNYKLYLKLGVDVEKIVNLYVQGGNDSIEKLNSRIKTALKDMRMFGFKRNIAVNYEFKKMRITNKKFANFCAKYNIEDMNDLLNFNTELDSFLIDDRDYSEEQMIIINKNRDNFRKRIGKSSGYFLNNDEAIVIKKKIEDIFNFNVYSDAFENSNFRDFFSKNSIRISEKNLLKGMEIYFNTVRSTGVCAKYNFDHKYLYYCLFNSSFLNYSSRWQDEVIIHEFVHALEGPVISYCKRLSHYTALNEALTEYITIQSLRYLDGHILSYSNENRVNRSAYENMLPMVEKLKNSDIWIYFLSAKLMDDAETLAHKIGYSNFRDICMCFDIVYSEPFDKYIADNYVGEIEEIIERINLRKR